MLDLLELELQVVVIHVLWTSARAALILNISPPALSFQSKPCLLSTDFGPDTT